MQDLEAAEDRAIVLFDGVCNLCNGWVRFIVERDRKGYFMFAPLQSEVGRSLLEARGLRAAVAGAEPRGMESIVLIEGSRCLTRSDAAIEILRHLSGLWPLLGILRAIPRPIRDRCYDVIARNRYRWFGRRETCMVPSPEIRNRFLK